MRQVQFAQYPFDTLSNLQLYHLLKLRSDVFVVEQDCVYPDLDNKDILSDTVHLLSESTDKSAPQPIVAYARCLAPGVSFQGCSIGRVVVAVDERGKGIANQLMREAIKVCQSSWPNTAIEIGAQVYLQAFYRSLGFVEISEPYDEDGIMHIDMRYKCYDYTLFSDKRME